MRREDRKLFRRVKRLLNKKKSLFRFTKKMSRKLMQERKETLSYQMRWNNLHLRLTLSHLRFKFACTKTWWTKRKEKENKERENMQKNLVNWVKCLNECKIMKKRRDNRKNSRKFKGQKIIMNLSSLSSTKKSLISIRSMKNYSHN